MTGAPLSDVLVARDSSEWIGDPGAETFVTVRMRGGGAVKRSIGEGKTPRPFRGQRVRAGDVIYSRIDARNGAFAVLGAELDGAVVSKDFPTFGVRADRIETAYLSHLIRSPQFSARFQAMSFGATNRQRIDERLLLAQRLPLPPLPEQRRVAAILDEADALRQQKDRERAAMNRFVDTAVAELINTADDWRPMGSMLAEPFRNGISPSRAGIVEAEVLTLSAITRGEFEPRHRKVDLFTTAHSPDKVVTEGLHLICRGNGNKDLVGAMAVADASVTDVAFPDTMIAMRPSKVITSLTLLAAWRGEGVREQIRRGARTTNGTYKVNQQLLGSVVVPVPSAEVQASIDALERQRAAMNSAMRKSAESLDTLFASLQHRAFRGEL